MITVRLGLHVPNRCDAPNFRTMIIRQHDAILLYVHILRLTTLMYSTW